MNKNILISDANHGGLILLDEYSKYTQNNLFFYDTYNKLTANEKKELELKYNITFLSKEDISKRRDEFTIISPIHMNPLFDSDYTHHEFTGYLINKHKREYEWNFKIIEITGVKGKTTTTNLIKQVLKNKNTLVLTSHNLIYSSPTESIILDDTLSITPASIITALNKANEYNLLDKIDYCIFEVSLGITSNTDIGILTNILENYPIAHDTQTASSAKKSVFSSKQVICDKESYDIYYSSVSEDNMITVSLNDTESDIFTNNITYDIKNTEINFQYNDNNATLNCFALTDFYVHNILFAIATGLLLDVSVNEIISNLKENKTLPGRGSCKFIEDKLILEDINPGLNTTSIKKCISNIKKYSTNYLLIIGGDYGITCEEINETKLLNYIKTIDETPIIFTGAVGYNLYKKLNGKYKYFEELNKAIKYSIKLNYELIQIIYRSEYNKKIN
ncbi:coenzyme F430 synthase [Methanosphaera sp.]